MASEGSADPADSADSADSGESRGVLRRLVAERGLTQAEFAARCGLSKDHVSRILRGAVAFPRRRETILRMARELGCEPAAFPEWQHVRKGASPSGRAILERLARVGMDESAYVARVPRFSPGYVRAILAGRVAFPRDPRAVKVLAGAANASPTEFPEYLPDSGARELWLELARQALDPHDFGVFEYLLEKVVSNTCKQQEGAR